MPRYSIADVETYSPADIETPAPAGPIMRAKPERPWYSRAADVLRRGAGDIAFPARGSDPNLPALAGDVSPSAPRMARIGEVMRKPVLKLSELGPTTGGREARTVPQAVIGKGLEFAESLTTPENAAQEVAMIAAGPTAATAAGITFGGKMALDSVDAARAAYNEPDPVKRAEMLTEAALAGGTAALGGRASIRAARGPQAMRRGLSGESRITTPPAPGATGEPMGPMPLLKSRPTPPPPAYLPGLAQRKAQAQTGLPIPSGVFRPPPTPMQRALEAEIGPVASSTVPSPLANARDLRPPPPRMGQESPFAAAVLPERLRSKLPPRATGDVPTKTYRAEDIAIEPSPAPKAMQPEAPREVAPPPVDAGPVPKGPKSAAESAEVLARENPPVFKSARESAEVFARSDEPMQREPLPAKPAPQPEPQAVKAGPRPAEQPASLFNEGKSVQGRDIFYLPTEQIKVDPARFQFKSNVGAKGVSDELKSVEKWDPAKGGVLAVWKDPKDGQFYVVNGHHRHELASRVGVLELPVVEVKARDAVEARAQGALINIADGKGTAVDAAKVLRDLNMSAADLEAEGISLKGAIARDATGLSGLPQNIFDMVAQGDLDVSQSAVIGDMLRDRPLDQTAAFDLLDQAQKRGKRLTPAEVREMISLQLKGQPEIVETQSSLFGDIVTTRSVLPEMAKLSVDLRKQIGSDKRLFSLVADEARSRKLSEAGNQIDTEGNANVATQASQVLEVYDRLSGSAGPVTDALTIGAERIANGENAATVRNETYDAIRSAVEQLIGNPRKAGGAGVSPTDAPRGGRPKRVPVEGATLGAGLGALQPHYERLVDPYVKKAAAKVPVLRKFITEEIVDRYGQQKKFEKRGAVSFDESPYAAMRLYSGVGGKIENRLNKLADALRPLQDSGVLQQAMKYAELERHEELGARIRDYKMPDGRTPADATADRRAMEQQLGQGGLAKVRQGLDQYRSVMNEVLQETRDAGLISDAAYQAILRGNEKYIPFDRVMQIADEMDGLHVGQRAFSVGKQDVIETIKGSERQIANPIESSIRKIANTISLAERNKVARLQAELASKPEFAGVIQKLRAGNKIAPEEKFAVLIDGVKQEYSAPREIVAAMKHMDVKESDLMTRWARASASMLRAGATELNPVFHVANVIRDYQTATLASGGTFTPATWLRGFAEAIRRGDAYRDFLESGGGQSGVFLTKHSLPETAKGLLESKRSKVIKTIVNPVRLMRTIGQTFELAPRLGVAGMAKKAGASGREAAFAARNATVDFSRAGNSMRILNMWVPFLNARMQGTINQYAALGRDVKGSASGGNKLKSGALLAYKLGAVAGLPLAVTYLNNVQAFPDEWDSLDQSEKDANFIVLFGKGRDEKGNLTDAIKIPKGEIQAIVNPIENFLEYMRDKDSKSIGQLALEISSSLSPVPFEDKGELSLRKPASTLLPPDAKVLAESTLKKNLYTGRDIVPYNMQKASPQEQYDETTPQVFRSIGRLTGTSPKLWENAVSTKFGGAGRFAAQASDLAYGDTAAPSTTGSKMAKRFIGAHANAEAQRDFDRLRDEDRHEADTRLNEERTAKALIAEIKSADAPKKAQILQQAIQSQRATPEVLKRMEGMLTQQADDITPFENAIRTRPARERAQYLINHIRSLPADKRAEKFERYTKKKIITGRVIEEMEAILSAQPKASARVPAGTF